MDRACIAVVDASHARLFTFERRSEPAGVTEELVEHDLVDPLVVQLRGMLRATHARRAIVCATPGLLGELRPATGELVHEGLEIDEVPRDLVELTPAELRAQLASYGLLPAASP